MNNFLLHHKEKKEKLFTKTFVGILLIVGVLVGIHMVSPNALSGAVHYVSAPFWKSKNPLIVSVVNSLELLRSKKSLIIENRELKVVLKESNIKLLETNFLREENESLKELLNRETFVREKTILGVVLTRPPVSLYDTFVIDVGREQGVMIGDSVFVLGDVFIGVVDEVYSKTSLVKLFSSPGKLTPVSIGLEHVFVNAEGVGSGNFIATLPRDTGVRKGDVVTMPGIDMKIFAVVEEIEADEADPFVTVFFKSPININEIKWVQVVTSE